MALTDYIWPLIFIVGICAAVILIYILSKSSRKPLPDVAGTLFSSNKFTEATKVITIPEENQSRFYYDKYNFKEKITGYEIIGLNPKTGKKLYKLQYGDNKSSTFTIEGNPIMFRYPDVEKALLGSGIREIYYADNDIISKMQNNIDLLNLTISGDKNKIRELSEGEKTRLQKTIEYQREQKRSAFGSFQPQQTGYGGYGFRPWRDRLGGQGGADEGSME